MSPLAENSGGACALILSIENTINARFKVTRNSLMFSGVLLFTDTKTRS